MNDQVLAAMLQSLDAREAVALVCVTEATGAAADQVGRHLVLWLDTARPP